MKINVNGVDVDIGDLFIVLNEDDIIEISATGLLVGGHVHVIDYDDRDDNADQIDIHCTDGDSFAAFHSVADITAAKMIPPASSDPCQVAAEAKGWVSGQGQIYHRDHFGSWKEAVSWSGTEGHEDHPVYGSWKECCEAEGIDAEGARNG